MRNFYIFLLLIISGWISTASIVEKSESNPSHGASQLAESDFDRFKRRFIENKIQHPEILATVFANEKVLKLCDEDYKGIDVASPPDSRAYPLGEQYLIQVACAYDADEMHTGADMRSYQFLLYGAEKGTRINGRVMVLPLKFDVVMYRDEVARKNSLIKGSVLPKFDTKQKMLELNTISSSFNQCPDSSTYRLTNERLQLVEYTYQCFDY